VSSRAVDVALPLPVQSTFTYRVPPNLVIPERGSRGVAPFGPRRVIGVVTGPAKAPEGRELKDILDVLDEAPLVPTPLLDLAAWMA
jgi:primosomal protein N' (replication factor Y)